MGDVLSYGYSALSNSEEAPNQLWVLKGMEVQAVSISALPRQVYFPLQVG